MSSPGRIYAIGINTFREAVRDRVLYGVLGAAVLVLVFTLALAELSLDQEDRVIADIGLASISIYSVIIAIFLGSSLLYKEIERKTLYVILPKPVHRAEFLFGKYTGIAATALVFVSIMGSIQLFVMSVGARGIIDTLSRLLACVGRALDSRSSVHLGPYFHASSLESCGVGGSQPLCFVGRCSGATGASVAGSQHGRGCDSCSFGPALLVLLHAVPHRRFHVRRLGGRTQCTHLGHDAFSAA